MPAAILGNSMLKIIMGLAAIYVIAWSVADREHVAHYRQQVNKWARPVCAAVFLILAAMVATSDLMPCGLRAASCGP